MVRHLFCCTLLITEKDIEREPRWLFSFPDKDFDVYMHSKRERERESCRLQRKHFGPLMKKQPLLLNLYLDVCILQPGACCMELTCHINARNLIRFFEIGTCQHQKTNNNNNENGKREMKKALKC